eukprot:gnl/Dysnectes_brevis/5768_a8505_595.p1 GENE.gnl/Dysnectes_brevis/5768_a8505_595~~gnl/Dysnectes_brevis/5768_a8505_595.p1  ORF type:complete len:230 (-),score=30.43 gnl/Dysnectes_brevis/5768_a8505_595:46-735(-)
MKHLIYLCDSTESWIEHAPRVYAALFPQIEHVVVPVYDMSIPLPDPTQLVLSATIITITGCLDSSNSPKPFIYRLKDHISDIIRISSIGPVNASFRMLGICFGAQLAANALGGVVRTLPSSLMLTQTLSLADPNEGCHTDVPVIETHSDHIVAAPGATILGTSSHGGCEMIEAFTVGRACLFTQFHPEFNPEAVQRLVVEPLGLDVPTQQFAVGAGALEWVRAWAVQDS